MKPWQITGKTRLVGVMGDPIEHSVSPPMHNAAFRSLGLDFAYVPFRVKKADLVPAVEAIRALSIRGLNVTIPHKVRIIPLLDKVDPLAQEIGAVNVVVNERGILTGYNTDAEGFLKVLLEQDIEPKGKNVVIIGAGGAARAIAFVLAVRGAYLTILNRTFSSATTCAADVSRNAGNRIEALVLDSHNLSASLKKADIVVNATNVGMFPQADETLVPGGLMQPDLIVADIVYNPLKTRLLREAEKAGARTINGLEMLIWQGALAFEKWTGEKAPLNIMRKESTIALRAYAN